MASPAYVWLWDADGNAMQSNCNVAGRVGAIETLAFNYSVIMPTDKYTGSTLGTRQHQSAIITKAYDPTSPLLFHAACHGKTLQKCVVKWYRTDNVGKEKEYFSHTLEDVKVVDFKQLCAHIKDPQNDRHTHEEQVAFRFAKITLKHYDGNIEATDEWTHRS